LATLFSTPMACCRWVIEQRHMKLPSNFVLRVIVEEDPKLVRTLNAHYADAAADGGLEADEKDALLDVIARRFAGRPWPRSGGMDATLRFMTDLQNAMVAARWSGRSVGGGPMPAACSTWDRFAEPSCWSC
jgi:hypothetical protein